MTQGHLDRSKAVRIAGAAKIAFVAVAACGIVATMMLGRGEIPSPQGPLTLIELPPLSGTQTTASNVASIDHVGIVERFELIANAPAKPAAPVDSESSTATAPPAPPADTIEYLGQIGFGIGKLALIRHNSVQRIVATGEAIGSFTIVEITPPKLVVQEGETRRDIELKAKSADVLSRTGGGAGTNGVNPAGFAANAGNANDPAAAARRAAAIRSQQTQNAVAARPNPNAAAQQNFQAGMKGKAAPINPTAAVASPKANSPEGFQARFDAVMERLKATGQFQNEDDMIEAAKKLLKAEEEDQ